MENLVQFQNHSGKWLRGMIHRPASGQGSENVAGVVFFHGFTGDRMESHWLFVKSSRALTAAGIASLRFDFYGSGESDGEFHEATFEGEISDAHAAVEFMSQQKGIDPRRLGLCGLSLGGAVAANLACRSGAKALVLLAAVAHLTQLQALAEQKTQPIPGDSDLREYSGHLVSSHFLDGREKFEPLAAIAEFHGPTLIIHPEKDEFLPLSHPEDFYQSAAARVKQKLIIPGADHTFTYIAWEGEVIRLKVEWFRLYLLDKPRAASPVSVQP